ncbi:hypothetical protein AAVH_20209 [Aphelenchoides avenae]|nr:hypothetical protein AAVH_20209 [Aphelenchus avenae]
MRTGEELRFRNSFIYSNASKRWSKAQFDAEQELSRVNALIRDYNLIAPTMDRQFMQLRMERERPNVQADVEKVREESELVKDVREALIREHNFRTSSAQESGILKNILSSF